MKPKAKRERYPWFMYWSRIEVIKRGAGYYYRVTFTPTGAKGEGKDRDEAVAALAAALGISVHSRERGSVYAGITGSQR